MSRTKLAFPFGLIAALFLLAGAANVSASVVINDGESAIYNFNMTNTSPPPPFSSVVVTVDYSFTVAGGIYIAGYDEFDATGTLYPFDDATGDGVDTFFFTFDTADGILDGLFSFLIRRDYGGPMTLVNVSAEGFDATGNSTGAIAAVPAPATFVLMGLGIAGFATMRRNKQGRCG